MRRSKKIASLAPILADTRYWDFCVLILEFNVAQRVHFPTISTGSTFGSSNNRFLPATNGDINDINSSDRIKRAVVVDGSNEYDRRFAFCSGMFMYNNINAPFCYLFCSRPCVELVIYETHQISFAIHPREPVNI